MQTRSPQFSRRFSSRLVAGLGVLLAISWGPLSQTIRLVEVSEHGKAGAECSSRIVLTRATPFDQLRSSAVAQRKSPAPATRTHSEKSTTERLINAVPDVLESSQPIHFDVGSAPIVESVTAWFEDAETPRAEVVEWQPDALAFELLPARAPPIA